MSSAELQDVITVENLRKSFGDFHVLKGISFSVGRGETVAILGRSGTGKSVTLKSIIGLLDPDAGRIEVLGKCFADMQEADRLQHRRNMGYVFQGAALFDSLTVCENVGFTLYQSRITEAEIRQRVLKRLEMVGLGHAIDRYPSELSGGMQKRVGLARCLIEEPSIILYDEPTSGLDPLTTDVINQIILRLRNQLKVSSVVVTHDIWSAFTIADRIIILDQGHILAQGTPAEIEQSELPWVQHFITGQALDHEIVESGGSRIRTPSISGRHRAVNTAQDARSMGKSGMSSTKLRAIRHQGRKHNNDESEQK